MAFAKPEAPDYFRPAAYDGTLVAFKVSNVAVFSGGEFDPTPSVIADVYVCDGPDAGKAWMDNEIINGPLVRELTKVVGGDPMLGRLRQITHKGNTTYVLDAATADDELTAAEHVPAF